MNREQSTFLRLPGEIRNRIYEFALSDKVVRVTVIKKTDGTPAHLGKYYEADGIIWHPVRFAQGVILASRDIHAETRLLLYKLAQFHYLPKIHDNRWDDWLDLLDPEKRDAIGIVRFNCGHWLSYRHPRVVLHGLTKIADLPGLKTVVIEEADDSWEDRQAVQNFARSKGWRIVFMKVKCCS